MPIRLIATDLDGTLLRPDLSVSPRTKGALDAARAAGIAIVPVTARQPIGVRRIAAQAGFNEWALCGNGALGVHLTSGEVLFAEHIAVAAQRALAMALNERLPGILFVSVRDGGEVFVAQHGYAAIADFEDHKRDVRGLGGHALEAVLQEPSLKFIVRHPDLTPRQLAVKVAALGLEGFAVTHSGAPFLEVLAFGDAPNDAEMLAWAGRGVAMANADPEAVEAADERTLSNTEDGVAVVIEDLLDRQRTVPR